MTNKNNIQGQLDSRSVRLDLDVLTKARYNRARANYGVVGKAESAMAEKAADSSYISRDLFGAVYAPNSRVDDATEGQGVRKVLDWATDQLQKLPEWRSLASASKGNVITSALATEAVVEHLSKLDWPEQPAEFDPNGCEMTKGENDGAKFRVEGKTLTKLTDIGGHVRKRSTKFGSEAGAQAAMAKAVKGMLDKGFVGATQNAPSTEAYAQAVSDFADALAADGAATAQFRGRVVGSIRKAADDAADANEMLSLSYGDGEGEALQTDPDEDAFKLATMVANSPDLKKFLKLVGSMLESMQTSPNRQRVRGNTMPYDIEQTRDVRRILPSELVMMADPRTKLMAIDRLMSGRMLGYAMCEMGTKERGPMFIALDMSSSMRSMQTEAKAFTVAAALHAADSNREVEVVAFNTRMRTVVSSISTPAERAVFIRAILTEGASGGTSFIPIVKRASELPTTTDVLLISDGCGAIDETFTRETFATRDLHYLVVGAGSGIDDTLRSVSKGRMMSADDITSGACMDFAATASAAR